MHSRNNSVSDKMSQSNKEIIKEIKRDLIRFVPTFQKRASRKTKRERVARMFNASCDYTKQSQAIIAPRRKAESDRSLVNSTCDSSQKTKSSEKLMLSQPTNENFNFTAKKLVYPSVRKLKNWMSSKRKASGVDSGLKNILFDHIDSNMKHFNLQVTQEIEAPSVSSKANQNLYPLKLPEIQKLSNDFKQIKVNHKKTGIMRRNGLLLEHIMHERIRSKEVYQPGLQHYRNRYSTRVK